MTTFPPPPAGHAWHNPDNLTPEQVGDGYRLLLESEILPLRSVNKNIHLWDRILKRWHKEGWGGTHEGMTYRVPLATWPLPAHVEPMPDAAEALAIVRALAEWSSESEADNKESLRQVINRARTMFATSEITDTP